MAEDMEQTVVVKGEPISPSIREQRFLEDKERLRSCCCSCHFVSLKTSSETSLSLEFVSGEKKVEYTILPSPDYPSGTVVTDTTDPAAVKGYETPLENIFAELCKDWCHDHELPLPEWIAKESSLSSIATTAADHKPELLTQISVASSMASSEMSDDDYFDQFDGYEEEEIDIVNPLIYRDIETIEKLYGESSIEYKIHAGINEMDVLLYIDVGFLDIHTASAWGVDAELSIVLQIHFQNATDYLDGPEPKIEVYQASPSNKEKKKFGLGMQIQKVVEMFLSNQWRSTSNHYLEIHYDKVAQKLHPSMETPTNTPPKVSQYPEPIQKLVDMGFTAELAGVALNMCEQDIQRAIDLLTTGELLVNGEDDDDNETDAAKKIKLSFPLKSVPTEIPKLGRQDSQGARASLSLSDNIEEAKKPPPLDDGFLGQIMKYILNRIPSLNEFCVICDERHVLETGLLKPCVCTRELCVFAFQTLGVMSDAAESVATDADVVDLMVAMCNAAATSNRAAVILDPYPSIVDPFDSQRLAMDPAKKDFKEVKTVLLAIINGREELLRGRCSHQSLKAVLDSHHRLAFPLMQWIVATNRAYIVMLPEDRQLQSMKTKYQFILISSPPAKEMAFQEAKKKHGSTFAFHGSSIENWHSIMRRGLLNASGTKYQLNGAAYGNGIYLSPNSGVSFGYSNRYHYRGAHDSKSSTSTDTLAGKVGLSCLALCEVVTSKELRRNGDIWVCANADHVVTRFFFVYDDRLGYDNKLVCTDKDKSFRQEITRAIGLAQMLKQKSN